MSAAARDDTRETRIHMEIIVDAYGPEEQALSWYYYLESHLQFPFRARCTTVCATSPLTVGERITVVGMAAEEECAHEMVVRLGPRRGRPVAVPLAQLEGVKVDDETAEALADWQYWVDAGYEL